nr:purine-nucleoside phosphorylase [Parashewanella tropica]
MMTPHINAQQDDFADIVFMPGDPLRAKHIAENYLTDAKLVTDVRNMFGYTGYFEGKKVSVMGHGMGVPSVSIYVHELITHYNVKTIIRVGSAGGIAEDAKVRDIIVATGAGTASATNRAKFAGYDCPATPDFNLALRCHEKANELGLDVKFGNIFTNDLFYGCDKNLVPALLKMNILAVEMETAALYTLAMEHKIKALSILTISDHVITGEETSSEERQNGFNDMMKLALATGC